MDEQRGPVRRVLGHGHAGCFERRCRQKHDQHLCGRGGGRHRHRYGKRPGIAAEHYRLHARGPNRQRHAADQRQRGREQCGRRCRLRPGQRGRGDGQRRWHAVEQQRSTQRGRFGQRRRDHFERCRGQCDQRRGWRSGQFTRRHQYRRCRTGRCGGPRHAVVDGPQSQPDPGRNGRTGVQPHQHRRLCVYSRHHRRGQAQHLQRHHNTDRQQQLHGRYHDRRRHAAIGQWRHQRRHRGQRRKQRHPELQPH